MTNDEAFIQAKQALTAAAKQAATQYVADLVAAGRPRKEIEEKLELYGDELVAWFQDGLAKIEAILNKSRTLH